MARKTSKATGPATYTLVAAGKALGLAASTVRRRILGGALRAEKDGARWIVFEEDLREYRRKRRYEPGHARGAKRPAPLTDEELTTLKRFGIHLCDQERRH